MFKEKQPNAVLYLKTPLQEASPVQRITTSSSVLHLINENLREDHQTSMFEEHL